MSLDRRHGISRARALAWRMGRVGLERRSSGEVGLHLNPMPSARSSERADALIRTTLSLDDVALRARYIETVVRTWPIDVLANALDVLCERAERAETASREALVAVVDALNTDALSPWVARLGEFAGRASYHSLGRLVRHAALSTRDDRVTAIEAAPVADVTRPGSRPLTLGERKSLARRPDRSAMQRLLSDPHPDVVRRCLGNPRITEDDVLTLAAKRPGRAEALAEIARSAWVHRIRVRLALVLNPATPLPIAARIAGLLLRHELETVARSSQVPATVRAVCLEHLARRPPGRPEVIDRRVH